MDRNELEQRSTTLRQDLKVWEKRFASQHDGRKAGRDDIKADTTISQKYKEYNKIRDILSGKGAPQTPSKRSKGREPQYVEQTPKAAPADVNNTPLKRKRVDDHVQTSFAVEFLSPQGPSMIGPTPQRNGIVLGLFDLLPVETPSKKRAILSEVSTNTLQTPRKKVGKAESEGSYGSAVRGEKTPQSSGKRFLLDRFVTPKKKQAEDQGTPTSALKGLSTPAFLRRDNILPHIEEENEATPRPAPWKRRSFGRTLSGMIQSMKQEQEDRLDEEADIMRELELEADGFILPPKKAKIPKILVQDSQAQGSLDVDGFVASEGEDDDQGEEATETRRWKKRGPKRQTRRYIMRPTITKPQAPDALCDGSDSEKEATVNETQPANLGATGDQESSDEEDYASDASHTPKKRKITQKRTKEVNGNETKDGALKIAAKKVKATAHANYRRLKIKSKGAGGGGKGRFGRRR